VWRWYEKRLLHECAHIIVVVPEAAKRLIVYGIPASKISVVSNTEDETTFVLSDPDPEILERYRQAWVVSYVGGIGPHRGVDTAICAMSYLRNDLPNAKLLLVGARPSPYLDRLRALIVELQVEDQVEIIGWQPFEKVSSYILASQACLVPHNTSEHTQTTIPHKLFQYMLAGKPVIVSDVRPLRRVVSDIESGLVFEAGEPTSLAQAIAELYKHPGLGRRLGQNGRAAAQGEYACRHDAHRLVELYQELAQSREARHDL
jgi:glycosyltransferase involved in cell wall biosynthesis